MPNPNELTAAEAARAIAEGRLTAVELAEACLDRIDALDERLKAWVYVDRETALADAQAADAAVSANRASGAAAWRTHRREGHLLHGGDTHPRRQRSL